MLFAYLSMYNSHLDIFSMSFYHHYYYYLKIGLSRYYIVATWDSDFLPLFWDLFLLLLAVCLVI